MDEIEHFVDSNNQSHPRLKEMRDVIPGQKRTNQEPSKTLRLQDERWGFKKLLPASAHSRVEIASKLRKAGIFSRVDDSNTSIGKRYARNDELGRNVILWTNRDQRIGSIDEVIVIGTDLVDGNIDWAGACQRLPAYDGVEAIEA
ncbi:hypothetical protein C8R42DRAFT_779057 [Lentinula raphanica]|nr:hypothetical protein C8R42DRAFT_779057 [Lentinula raphanica]